MNLRKQTLWHTIDWYASSIGTEHEKRERKVLDQAIDAALGVVGNDKLREAAEEVLRLKYGGWIACTYPCCVRDDGGNCRPCDALDALRAALAVIADGQMPCKTCGTLVYSSWRNGYCEVCWAHGHTADAPPSTNSGEVVNELVVGINGAPEWPMWLDPEDDPLVLRNLAKPGYTLDQEMCDFLLSLAENIEKDFAGHTSDAAPVGDAHNLPGASRPNHCPGDGNPLNHYHSWDSYGDEWRCSFCPAVFRAHPFSDAAVAVRQIADLAAWARQRFKGDWQTRDDEVTVVDVVIRHVEEALNPEDAPGGPTEEKDPHWPYTHSVDGDTHRNCSGQLRYRVLNSDHDDREYRCDECKKIWVEEGPDA